MKKARKKASVSTLASQTRAQVDAVDDFIVTIPPPPSLLDLSAMSVDVPANSLSATAAPLPESDQVPTTDEEYKIRSSFHPRRKKPDTFVSLTSSLTENSSDGGVNATYNSKAADIEDYLPAWHDPWAPFSSRADFELAERFTRQKMNDSDINTFLSALGPSSGQPDTGDNTPGYQPPYVWHLGRSLITMRRARDYHAMMTRARTYILKV
jgi:hypothetical protein